MSIIAIVNSSHLGLTHGLTNTVAATNTASNDELTTAVQTAADTISLALAPSIYDVLVLVISGISAVAAIVSAVVIILNLKTIKIAQQQINMGLYPTRRDVLKKVEEGNRIAVRELAPDIEFLFGAKVQACFKRFIQLDDELRKQQDYLESLIDDVAARGQNYSGQYKSSESDKYEFLKPIASEERKLKKEKLFKQYAIDQECLQKSNLETEIGTLLESIDNIIKELRVIMVAEISESLHS